MCIPVPPPPKDSAEVPLGDGLAQRARVAIMSRQRRIDDAVEAAQRKK